MRIQQLDASVVNKIAAGEVVERPANAVKELLENSIDALATRVEIEVGQGGTELIRILDNGEGIHADDLLLAVAPHATSKIQSADDLFHVRTMGFRGEALASIAEVSRFRIRSRREDSDTGNELAIEFGTMGAVQPCGCAQGTLVEIRQLFANTPVRRKFLKTVSTEFGHISEQFTRVALSHPRLHLVLKHNDKVIYELPATDRLIERLSLFFGADLAEQLIWVESQSDETRMWGYVAHPDQSKSTRKGQYFFLNGRCIQDRSLQHALTESYRGLLMTGRQPIAVLFIEIPVDRVDVNVHPTKSEVRFRDSQQLYRQLLAMIRTKFLSMELTSELRVPTQDTARTQMGRRPGMPQGGQVQLQPWSPQGSAFGAGVSTAPRGMEPPSGTPADFLFPAGSRPEPEFPSTVFPTAGVSRDRACAAAVPGGLPEETSSAAPTITEDIAAGIDEPSGQSSSEETAAWPPVAPTRAMQVHDSYIVVETDEGLALIDQHALHERILYEQLRSRVLAGTLESQRLLVPLSIELSPQDTAILLEQSELLSELGFGIEEFGTNTVLLNRYPALLAKADLTQLARDLSERLGGVEEKPTRRDLLDDVLHMMACKAAIKAGHRLTAEEIESLLAQRHLIDDAHHCPHGRPTALVLSQAELDRQFGRLG